MLKEYKNMTKDEIKILSEFIQTFIVNSSKCQKCTFNHGGGMCFFASKCLLEDFSFYDD